MMYGTYMVRAQASTQDEDSGSFPNLSQSGKQKRVRRLGRGGLPLPKHPDRNQLSLSENDEVQEHTNDDSNSYSGPASSSVLSWLHEIPLKDELQSGNNSNTPFAQKTSDSVNHFSETHAEKSSIVNYIEGIAPISGNYDQFSEIKPNGSENPVFISECKRSLTFKSCEQKSNVLQDVANKKSTEFIHKTPGSKMGFSNRSEKENKKSELVKDKENCISQLFQTPNICNLFDTEAKNEHFVSQSLNFRFTSNNANTFNKFGYKLPFEKMFHEKRQSHIDALNKCNLGPDYKLFDNIISNDVNPLNLSENQLKISSDNKHEVKDLKINNDKDHLPIEQNQIGQSGVTSSFQNSDVSNLFSGCSTERVCEERGESKLQEPVHFNCFTSDSKNPGFVPSNNKSLNNIEANPFDFQFIPSILNECNPPNKTFNEHCIQNKHRENVIPSIIISPPPSSFKDRSNTISEPKVTTALKPITCNDASNGDGKKIKKCTKSEEIQLNDNKISSGINNIKEQMFSDSNNKKQNKNMSVTPEIQNEEFKVPSSNGSALPLKPPSVSTSVQSSTQEKQLMAPPSTNTLIKQTRGISKTSKSSLLRTRSNNRSNPGFKSEVVSSRETLYINNTPYVILSTLGKGGSSEVFLVLESHSSKLMAVKCVNLKSVETTIANGYLNEVELLLKLQGCDSVIHMYDHEYIEDEKLLYVVMEKGDTDLSKLLRDIQRKKKISMSMIIYYWTEMLNAVKEIHHRGIIHSDLKPANFLLVCGRLKLIDFGIASSLQGDMTSVLKDVTTGTWNYMSPEAIRNNGNSGHGHKINYKSDVWSLGCILYNLVYKKTPFSHITSTWGKLTAIVDESHVIKFPEKTEGGEFIPAFILKTLKNCLVRDPKRRPSVKELLESECYEPSHNLTKDNIENTLCRSVKDNVIKKLVNILSPEDLEKITHILVRLDGIDRIINEVVEEIKFILPSHWEKIAGIFEESQMVFSKISA
ncbi:dual specificity protein kinase monopolar spindle 1 [Lycorma delicatula]|uniref:dual specificity protein kinase monopolar spindle 1 n=1 Tax=Lycorma delicatula TaxID=130591 RepID=UPI003F51A46F